MRLICFALASSISALPALAAEPAKSGDDSYTTRYVVTFSKPAKFGDRTVTLVEFGGISTNDKGAGMFHDMGVRCTGIREAVAAAFYTRGTCADTDSDGDQVFSTYEANGGEGKPAVGVHQFIGGTGKYTGMTGKADYTVQYIKSADGPGMFVAKHTVTWKLP